MTMRGLDEDDFREVGRIMCDALSESADTTALSIRSTALVERRPPTLATGAYPTFGEERD